MLSRGGARGVKKAELNRNVDSDYDHGGSSRTYVLHRTGCSQEDDQLLRQGCERSGPSGRADRSDTLSGDRGFPTPDRPWLSPKQRAEIKRHQSVRSFRLLKNGFKDDVLEAI